MAKLIFLRVEVFLATGFARRTFHQLVSRPVEAVIRGQRRRQYESGGKYLAKARLQRFMQDVGRIRPNIRSKVFSSGPAAEFGEILGEFLLGRAPREIRVRLRESQLG